VGSGGFGLGEFLLPKEPDASRTASRSGDGHGGAMPLAAEEAAMTCLKPQGGRRKRPKTSLRISPRSPITTQLTPSHHIPEDPGRQRRETHGQRGCCRSRGGAPGGNRTPDPRLRSPSAFAVFSASCRTGSPLEGTNPLEGSAPPTRPISSTLGARTENPARPDDRPRSSASEGPSSTWCRPMLAASHPADSTTYWIDLRS
jgi:hypothetical protein